ncbi:gap junction delta-2 protein-like [Hirundo rustica]|uniref:gap junction delta-2 protein-like n=1 Tax=Hirundo rustica TaxID=43150 RepID=UPI001A947805|nr:gap junction delta-2 protein-like [Hirundo rustica]
MGEWTILERLLEAAVQQHSTMIGRILLTVVVIFRILIVAIVGETVYEDEQSMFLCNALQPGCNQACYDLAFPISHMRYWVFQILLVCTPSLCFITYSVHQAAKRGGHRGQRGQRGQRGHRRCAFLRPLLRPRRRRGDTEGDTEGDIRGDTRGDIEGDTRGDAERSGGGAKGRRHEGISRFYVIQVVFRNALEIGFLGGQYFLYGFKVPAIFECRRYPCLKEVECYVSRPTEKSVFLVFMFAVSGVCVLLNLAELNHLGWRKVRAAVRGARARRRSLPGDAGITGMTGITGTGITGTAGITGTGITGTGITAGITATGITGTMGRTQSSESAYV